MKWISVLESLPNDMENVLLYDETEGLAIGYLFKQNSCFIQNLDGLKLKEVSHWMPFPQLPSLSLDEEAQIKSLRETFGVYK